MNTLIFLVGCFFFAGSFRYFYQLNRAGAKNARKAIK